MRFSEKAVIACASAIAYLQWVFICPLLGDRTARITYLISGHVLLGIFVFLLIIFRRALRVGDKRFPTSAQIEIEVVRHAQLSKELNDLGTITEKASRAQATLPPAFIAIKEQKEKELGECLAGLQQLRKLDEQEHIVREAEQLMDKMQPQKTTLLRPSKMPSDQLLQPTDTPE